VQDPIRAALADIFQKISDKSNLEQVGCCF